MQRTRTVKQHHHTAVISRETITADILRSNRLDGVVKFTSHGQVQVCSPSDRLTFRERLDLKTHLTGVIGALRSATAESKANALKSLNDLFLGASKRDGSAREITGRDVIDLFALAQMKVSDEPKQGVAPAEAAPGAEGGVAVGKAADRPDQKLAAMSHHFANLALATLDLNRHPEREEALSLRQFRERWGAMLAAHEPGAPAEDLGMQAYRELMHAVRTNSEVAEFVMDALPLLLNDLGREPAPPSVDPVFVLAALLVMEMPLETLKKNNSWVQQVDELFVGAKLALTLLQSGAEGKSAEELQELFQLLSRDPDPAKISAAIGKCIDGADKARVRLWVHKFGILMVNMPVEELGEQATIARAALKHVPRSDNHQARGITYIFPGNMKAFMTAANLSWNILRSCPVAAESGENRNEAAAEPVAREQTRVQLGASIGQLGGAEMAALGNMNPAPSQAEVQAAVHAQVVVDNPAMRLSRHCAGFIKAILFDDIEAGQPPKLLSLPEFKKRWNDIVSPDNGAPTKLLTLRDYRQLLHTIRSADKKISAFVLQSLPRLLGEFGGDENAFQAWNPALAIIAAVVVKELAQKVVIATPYPAITAGKLFAGVQMALALLQSAEGKSGEELAQLVSTLVEGEYAEVRRLCGEYVDRRQRGAQEWFDALATTMVRTWVAAQWDSSFLAPIESRQHFRENGVSYARPGSLTAFMAAEHLSWEQILRARPDIAASDGKEGESEAEAETEVAAQ